MPSRKVERDRRHPDRARKRNQKRSPEEKQDESSTEHVDIFA